MYQRVTCSPLKHVKKDPQRTHPGYVGRQSSSIRRLGARAIVFIIMRGFKKSCLPLAEQGKWGFPVPPFLPEDYWSREIGSDVLSRVGALIHHTQAERGANSRAPILPLSSTASICTANGHRVRSPDLSSRRAIAYRWRSPPRVRWHRVISF